MKYSFIIDSQKYCGEFDEIFNFTKFYLRAKPIPDKAISFLRIKYMQHICLITLDIYDLSLTKYQAKYLKYFTKSNREYYYSYIENDLLNICDNDYLDIYSEKYIVMLLPIYAKSYQPCLIHCCDNDANANVASLALRNETTIVTSPIRLADTIYNTYDYCEILPGLFIYNTMCYSINAADIAVEFNIKPEILLDGYQKLMNIVHATRLIKKLQ